MFDSSKLKCRVIFEPKAESKLKYFEEDQRFAVLDFDLEYVYVDCVDRIMGVKRIVPCGRRNAAANRPDLLIHVYELKTFEGLEEDDSESED